MKYSAGDINTPALAVRALERPSEASVRQSGLVLRVPVWNTVAQFVCRSRRRVPGILACALLGASLMPAQQFISGQAARMTIGQATFTDEAPGASDRLLGAAGGVAYANGVLVIADSTRVAGASPLNRRVLVYKNIQAKFPDPAAVLPLGSRCSVCTGRNDFPSAADVVLGQPDFTTTDAALTQAGLRLPTGVATDGNIIVVADTENNRVLIWNSIPSTNGAPASIVLGQADFVSVKQPNVVTASSFRGPQGVWLQDGRLFVADTQNHRILIWNRVPTSNNQAADLVLGQPNFTTAPDPLVNFGTATNEKLMENPVSVTSDGRRLYVADLGFNRILIWNTIPTVNQQAADVVIGEPDMTSLIEGGNDVTKMCPALLNSDGTQQKDANGNVLYPARCEKTLSLPRFALSDGTRLFVADGGNDRILIYNTIPTTNGVAADIVLGQPDFTSDINTDNEDIFTPNLVRSSSDTVRTPTALAWDGMNLYVTDPYDRRVLVFTPALPNIPLNGVRNAASINVYAVGSVIFTGAPKENDSITLTIGGTDYKYKAAKNDTITEVIEGLVTLINAGPDPNVLALANLPTSAIILTARKPGADGNSITVTDTLSSNSGITAVTITAPTGGQDAAKIAPGTLVSIMGTNLADSMATAPSDADPLPRTLGGVQVYFDGIRAPLLMVSPTQINTQVPYEVSDSTSISAWVRTTHNDGSVSVTSAIGVPITQQNPGIFAEEGADPRPAIAFHASSNAAVSVLLSGAVAAGDSVTLTIEDRSYTYTMQASDSLDLVRDAIIAQVNANSEEKVTAVAGGSFQRIVLYAKLPGPLGNGIAVSTSSGGTSSVTLSATNPATCCASAADQRVTVDNPAQPGEFVYVYATGLGLVQPDQAKTAQVTGYKYTGPEQNQPNSFVSSLAGGKTANIIQAGALPGTVGIYKVILELAADLPTNPLTQLTIAQDIYVSNIVTIPLVNPVPVATQ